MLASLLFSEMTPPPEVEAAFNEWYDREHIPLRMGAPGFRSARRYRQTDGASYLAVYEIDDIDALQSEPYRLIKENPTRRTAEMLRRVSGFTRYLARGTRTVLRDGLGSERLLDAPVLYSVFFEVPQERVSAFDAWYDDDHIPILMECPQWRGVRRFVIEDGQPERWTHLAVHYIEDVAALDSDARQRARSTPVRAALAAEPWFQGSYRTFRQLRAFSREDAISRKQALADEVRTSS
jgi:hypothetical protein